MAEDLDLIKRAFTLLGGQSNRDLPTINGMPDDARVTRFPAQRA